uniref:Histidine acid phosphatase family protein n=1 Tax=Trepomonas sp. PC1 TaxID=1076344 RepID=A0A146K934_9EUKA|eukprot:JAP93107.1 Histidine acid phosphatase family protein [Trepomonas sp. PC1]
MFQIVSMLTPSSVLIMTRHGSRAPLRLFPGDDAEWNCDPVSHNFMSKKDQNLKKSRLKLKFDVRNELKGSCFTGQLSSVGYQQHLRLSELWTKLYPQFDSKFLRSTHVHRVQISLLGQLHQLKHEYDSAHIGTKDIDTFVHPDNCSQYFDHLQIVQDSMGERFRKKDLQRIQNQLNWSETNWEWLGDDIRCRDAMNVSYPKNIALEDAQLSKNMIDSTWRQENCMYENKEERLKFMKLQIGASTQDILTYLDNQSFTIVSAHDTTIAPYAAILFNSEDWECGQPKFASFIAMERYGDNIKIRFRYEGDGEGKYMKMAACGKDECTWQEFKQHLSQYSVTMQQRDDLCNAKI